MATDDQSNRPVWRKLLWQEFDREMDRVENNRDHVLFGCLQDLRDRIAALQVAAAQPAPATARESVNCLPEITPAVWVGTPADVAPQVVPTTPAVLTVDELADCLPVNAWAGPEGYSRQAFARHLLDHPRIGPLLRGEGAPAQGRVVLQDWPPKVSTPLYWNSFVSLHGQAWQEGHTAGWAAARAEVERQQQGGQADG